MIQLLGKKNPQDVAALQQEYLETQKKFIFDREMGTFFSEGFEHYREKI